VTSFGVIEFRPNPNPKELVSPVETPPSNSTSLKDLKPGMPLTGRVTRLELSGAVIDVGVGTDGLVHISRLKRGRVNRVEEVVQVGQEVEVWVERVDETLGRLDLTMIRPLAFEWHSLRPGVRAVGKVVSIERYGAFVDIGAERSGLVHVSEMGDDYVARPEDVVKVGETIEVIVLEADRKKKQIKLSMKGAQAIEVEEESAEPAPATAMEIALRKAMGDSTPVSAASSKAAPPPKTRKAQEDLLARTLQQRAKTTTGK
jgi:ribosomal protein S1